MLSELDLLLGLAMASKDDGDVHVSIISKANELNRNVDSNLRKSIIVPIIHSRNANSILNEKCDEYFKAERIKRGIHYG